MKKDAQNIASKSDQKPSYDKLAKELASLKSQYQADKTRLEILLNQRETLRRQRESFRKRCETLIAQNNSSHLITAELKEQIKELNTFLAHYSQDRIDFPSTVKHVRNNYSFDRVATRSFCHLLYSQAETSLYGALGIALISYFDELYDLAYFMFNKIDTATILLNTPIEYITTLLHNSDDRHLSVLNSLMEQTTMQIPDDSWVELARTYISFNQADMAEILLDKASPDNLSTQRLAQYDRMQSYFKRPVQNNNASTHMPTIGILDYKTIDPKTTSGRVNDYILSLSTLTSLLKYTGVTVTSDNGDLSNWCQKTQEDIKTSKQDYDLTGKINLVTVNRDFSHSQEYSDPTWVVVAGDLMEPNIKSLYDIPFQKNIAPIFISVQLKHRKMLTDSAIEYIKQHEPIGCRDWTTVYILREYGIKSFYSGCITSTLDKLFNCANQDSPELKTGFIDFTPRKDDYPDTKIVKFDHVYDEIRTNGITQNLELAVNQLNNYCSVETITTSSIQSFITCKSIGISSQIKTYNNNLHLEGITDITDSDLIDMKTKIEEKLDLIYRSIISGEDKLSIYQKWNSVCAHEVLHADSYCAEYSALPSLNFNLEEMISLLHSEKVDSPNNTNQGIDEQIHIALASDNNYFTHLAVVMESVLSNTKERVHFHIMSRKLTSLERNQIFTSFSDASNITFYNFDKVDYGDNTNFTNIHLTTSSLDRVLIPELLHHLDKVIYLDVDLIVLGDVAELWNIDLQDKPLAGRESKVQGWQYGHNRVYRATNFISAPASWDISRRIHHEGRLDFTTISSGVLLLNLNKLRDDKFTYSYLPYIEHYSMIEQDAFNIYARDNVVVLGTEWNAVPVQDITENAKLIHFAGPLKPWADWYVIGKEHYEFYLSQYNKRLGSLQPAEKNA